MPSVPYDPFKPRLPAAPPAVPDNRTPLTGTFNPQVDAPANTPPPPPGQSQFAGQPNGSYSGYTGPAPAYAGDAPGTGNAASSAAQQAAAAGYAATHGSAVEGYPGGYNPMTTLGGSPGLPFGDPARAANQQLQMQAYGVAGREAPQIGMGATNMFAQGTGNALTNANQTNLLGVRQGLDMSSLANGPGVAAQYGAANALMGMSQMPAGPSVAEQQLRMGGDAAMRQQMAMAAGARGGNAALALQNAGQNQGDIMGNLNGQMGIQRAQEDMANRQFSANAAQAAGGMYGQALGSQMGALGGSANIFGGVAGNQLGQANTNLGLTQTYGGLASDQARIQGAQNQLNDQTMLGSQQMGYDILNKQRAAEMEMYGTDWQLRNQRYGIDKNYNQQLEWQKRQQANDWTKDLLGAGLTAAGAVGGFMVGGPGGAVAGGAAGNAIGNEVKSSDIRAKKKIAPAGEQISNAFRSADQSAAQLMGTQVGYPQLNAPGYSYEYKNPGAPGAEPGQKFGPMAQDLEKTPAGASVVHEVNGKKAVDPGRLALLSASEISKQRQEIDELKAKLFGKASGQQFAPNSGITGQRVMYHNGKPIMTGRDAAGNLVALDNGPAGASFGGYGAPGEVNGYTPQHGPVMQSGPMRVRGVDAYGRPIMAPEQTPSAGPSIGFGEGDMGFDNLRRSQSFGLATRNPYR